jgi:hypothetical protein
MAAAVLLHPPSGLAQVPDAKVEKMMKIFGKKIQVGL